eukprot:gene4919-6132_t
MSHSKPQTAIDKFSKWYMTRLQSKPISTKALTSAALSFTGNVVAQALVEKKKVDWLRVLKFTIWGLISSPLVHFWHKILDTLFKNVKSRYQVYGKLIVDQLVFAPFINIVFYSVLAILDGKPKSIPIKLFFDLLPTLKASWKVWPLAQFINFGFVPPQLRVLFGNMVGFLWGIYLTILSSRKK